MMFKSDLISKLESKHQVGNVNKAEFFSPQYKYSQFYKNDLKCALCIICSFKVIPINDLGSDLNNQHTTHLQWTS